MDDKILSSFQQAKKGTETTILDNLKNYLQDIIQFDAAKTKKKSDVQIFAKKHGTFLIKLVTQNLKDLETETTIELINLKSSATELALNQLDKIQSELTASKLDLEKFWSKLVSRVVGSKQYATSLRYADIFLDRLKVFQQKEWQVKEGSSLLPSRKESPDFCGCLLNGLISKATCLIETSPGDTRPFETFVNGTCLAWLEYFHTTAADKCAPYYDAMRKTIYRLLTTTHPKDAKECSVLRLSLKLGALKENNTEEFLDNMYRSAFNFDSGNRNNANAAAAIIIFYCQGFEMIKKMDKFYPQYMNCLYHFASFAKSQPDKEAVILKALNFLETVSVAASQKPLINVHITNLLLHIAISEMNVAAAKKVKKVSSECLSRLEKASSLISTCVAALKIDTTTESAGEPPHYSALTKLAKYLMELKKIFQQHCSTFHQSGSEIMEVPAKGLPVFERLMVACADVLATGTKWEQQFEAKGIALKTGRFKGFLSTQLDALSVASQISYTATSDMNEALNYLRKAEEAAQADTSELRWVANAYYNLGVKLYGMELYEDAIPPLSASCRTWEAWWRVTGDHATAKLTKKYELLAGCLRQTSNLKAIRVSELPVSSSLMESFVRIQSKLKNEPDASGVRYQCSLLEVLQSRDPPANSRQKGAVLEEMYRAMHALPSLHNFYDLLEVLDELLTVYTQTELPIHRARVLVERGKLLRLFNPKTEQPDGEAASAVIQNTIELLEKDVIEKKIKELKGFGKDSPAKAFESSFEKASKLIEAKKRDYSKVKDCLQIVLRTALQAGRLQEFGNYLQTICSQNQEDAELISLCEPVFEEQQDLLQLLDDLAQAYCWLGMIRSEVDDTNTLASLRTAVALWSELVQQLDPNQEPAVNAQRFKSVDASLYSMKTVAGFLQLKEELCLQLAVLDVFVSVAMLANPDRTEAASDVVYGYCTMVQAYLSLGLEKQAVVCLQKAQQISDNLPESSFRLLQMTSFLVALSTEENASDDDLDEFLESILNKDKKTREEVDWIGQLYYLKSLSFYNQHNSMEALDHATDALAYRKGCLPQFYAQLVSSQAESSSTTELTSQWNTLTSFTESLHQTAVMWENLGDPIRSQMYHKIILDLAEELNNHNLKVRSLLATAVLDFKCHKWEEFNEHVSQLESTVQNHCSHQQSLACKYHVAECAALRGDLMRHNNQLEQALKSYIAAEKLTASVFVALQSAVKDIATFLSSSDNIPKNVAMLASPRKGKPRALAVDEAISLMQKASIEDHKYLTTLLCRIHTKQGLVHLEISKWDQAKKCLTGALALIEERPSTPETAMVLYFLGLVSLYQYEDLTDAFWKLVQKEPEAKPAAKTKRAPAKSKAVSTEHKLAECQKYLEEAYSIATQLRIPQWVQQIAKARAMVTGRTSLALKMQTSALLSCAIGAASSNQMRYFISRKKKALEDNRTKKKSRKAQDSVDQLSDMLSNLSIKDATRHRLQQLERIFNLDMDNFEEEVIRRIPHSWTVCSISVVLDKYLVLSKWRTDKEPLIVRVPLTQSCEDEEESTNMLLSIREELESILSGSRARSVSNEDSIPQDNWKSWWQHRESLDDRMGKLLNKMEQLLSCWKGILVGSHEDGEFETALQDKSRDIIDMLEGKGYQVDTDYVELCFMAFPHLTDNHNLLAKQLLCQAFNWKEPSSLTSKQSKELDDIIVSLRDQYLDVANKCAVSAMTLPALQELPRQPVILILDKDVQNLPWESIPMLRNHSVCRMISVPFLLSAVMQKEAPSITRDGVDPRKVTYILNPGMDLETTQANFEKYFKSQQGWNGIVCREPSADEVKGLLQSSNMMIYCGHNAGEKYLSVNDLLATDNLLDTVVLLMGCSSGHLKEHGEFDPAGMALGYILSGCPAVVGNLWDVTDRDLDRFTETLLRGWLENDKKWAEQTISNGICEARKSCKLKNLIGAAPVCYGVPIVLKQNTFSNKVSKPKAIAVEPTTPEAPRKEPTKEQPAVKVKASKAPARTKRTK